MLAVPRFEEQRDDLEVLKVESLFFDADLRESRGREGGLVAKTGAGRGDEGGQRGCDMVLSVLSLLLQRFWRDSSSRFLACVVRLLMCLVRLFGNRLSSPEWSTFSSE